MTAKDKAKELEEKYQKLIDPNNNNEHWFLYKQCALIAVDEIWENCEDNKGEYWREVKNEIEKL